MASEQVQDEQVEGISVSDSEKSELGHWDEGEDDGTDRESSTSGYSWSESTDGLEPEWLDSVQKNGELFYLELSEGEEEVAVTRYYASQAPPTNHVRFSDKEAEIITDAGRQKEVRKAEPKLKKLAKILKKTTKKKKRPSHRQPVEKAGSDLCGDGDSSCQPTSILKNQAGQHGGVQPQQLKEVFVYLNPKRLGSRSPSPEQGGLLEALLGVMYFPTWSRTERDGPQCSHERITVHCLVPNSPAIKCGQILIGDILVAVDDVDVTPENIERVLSCISGPTQVKLTLETASVKEGQVLVPPRASPMPSVSQLVKLLWGEDTVEMQMSILHIPHIVMYLSLKLDSKEESDKEEEVLYQYPVSEASGQLKAVRGVFITLCDMLGNVTGGQILSSSLLLDKEMVHVGYWKEGDNLLVLGLPASRVPLLQLRTVISGVVRTLRVMYGSLDSAFSEAEHGPRLDHFFCLFFQQHIQPSQLSDNPLGKPPDVSSALFLDGLPGVRWLTLPSEVKVEIDTILSDFESSDFGEMSEDFFGMRRLYVTLGSCLFYKGYLLANHLQREDLLDVSLYCQHYCLLPLASEQRIGQLVIWREVFPQRRTKQVLPNGYREVRGRCFLLIVGLKHFLQCVLLEAGGCASSVVGIPGPDCVYVDQVKATLLQLEVWVESIEERLATPPGPSLTCADWFIPAGRSSPILSRLTASIRAPSPAGRRSLFTDTGSEAQGEGAGPVGLTTRTRRESLGSGGSDGSGGSGSLFKIPKKKHPNPFYLGTLKRNLPEKNTDSHSTLTSGAENTLFHYVCMETVQGVFITPTHEEVSQLSGSIHPQLIRNFHRCCLSIRATFQQSLRPREKRGTASPHGLGSVKEHGVLFQCKPDNWPEQKPPPTMTYWVIGRMTLEPVPQEFYVCFHDSVPEVPVEMAFRLSFGLAL